MKIKLIDSIIIMLSYLLVPILTSLFDILLIRRFFLKYKNILVLVLNIIFSFIYLYRLNNKFNIRLDYKFNMKVFLLGFIISLVLYIILDKGIDPILANIFPNSEIEYDNSVKRLLETPMISFIQVCLLAPIVEEVIMRGTILEGLKNNYGNVFGIIISSIVFGVLHFNKVQTISAIVAGLVLGIVYVLSGNILLVILAHSFYNFISFIEMMIV